MNDDVADLVKRAETAERFVEVLTEQLRGAEQRDHQFQAQIRQLTALVEGMQRQLRDVLAELAAARGKKKGKTNDAERAAAQSPEEDQVPEPDLPGLSDRPKEHDEPSRPKRKPKRNKSLPDHLPRHVVRIPVTRCDRCGGEDLAGVGAGEISERYDYVPAQVRVERMERQTCRCRSCGTLTTAPMPPVPVPGGSMTAALYAHIAYSKCCMHLTLNRIAEDLRRLGADLADATMCDAMGHIANLLDPVCDAITDGLFESGLIHLDGTGVKVLMPKQKGSYRGQFTVLSNAQATAYFFSETKAGEHIASFLRVGTSRAYAGYVVADAANNMDLLYKDGTIVECGCWYHARDKFVEAEPGAPFEALEAIAWIKALFEIEHEADRAGDSDDERRDRRRRDAVPVLEGFWKWMEKTQPRFDPAEEIWKAIQYCKNHRIPLKRFLDAGRIPLTNNQAERDLGPIGRGRKAWLFAGSDNGGHRLAKIYTVVGTCLRLDIDPRVYLTDVLPKLSTMPVNRGRGQLAALLPKAWKASRQAGLDPPP